MSKLNELEVLANFVEVGERLTDFSCCTFEPERPGREINVRLYADGQVICPADKGGWSGQLRYSEEGEHYYVEFNNDRIEDSSPKAVYMDLRAADRRLADLDERAENLQAEAVALRSFLQRARPC